MDTKKHCFMSLAALLFLGLIIAKPGEAFYPVEKNDDCKKVVSTKDCRVKEFEYRLNYPVVNYEYNPE